MDHLLGDSLAIEVIAEHGRLGNEMANWKSHYDEVSQYFIPRKDNIYGQSVSGEKKFNLLYDSEGVRAVDELASVLSTTIVNPQSLWFGLAHPDPAINEIERVKKWLYDSTLAMVETFNGSNFQTSILEVFTDLVSIGTASMRIEEDDIDVLRFYTQTIYQIVIEENNKGIIDTVSRSFGWNKRKIMAEFKDTKEFELNKIEVALGDDLTKKWEIIHMVRPRSEFERKFKNGKSKAGPRGMPWASIYVIKDLALTLKESGFHEFPYAVPRWTKLTEETLGRSPAMKVLSDAKMLNEEKKVFIKSEQLNLGPPLAVPDQGFLTKLKVSPFSINYKRKGKDDVKQLFDPRPSGIGIELLEMTKLDIRKGFFLHRLNVELGDRATTVEVVQKRDENLRVLSPFMTRMDRELLRPTIDRSFGIMVRGNEFGPIPDELKGVELKVRYKSMVAKAQLIVESENFVRAISATQPLLDTNPEIMDNIDADEVLRQNWDRYGVDPGLLRTKKQVSELRQKRQKAAQQDADIQKQLADAQTIKQVGDADAKRQRQ